MVVEIDVRQFVYEAVEERVSAGKELRDAATEVFDRLRAERLVDAWMEEIGVQSIADFWRAHNRDARTTALTGRPRNASPIHDDDTDEDLLAKKWPVKSGWKALGDMTLDDVREQERYYRLFARSYKKRADMFQKVGAIMEPGQTVRECWSAEALAGIYQDPAI